MGPLPCREVRIFFFQGYNCQSINEDNLTSVPNQSGTQVSVQTLIKGLNGEADGFESAGAKDGIVTMGELKDYMKTAMPDETQKVLGVAKHPVIATSTGDPNIWNLTLQVTQ